MKRSEGTSSAQVPEKMQPEEFDLVLPRKYDATFALWMMFLLGKHAMFGQEPPIYLRSTTATFFPSPANVVILGGGTGSTIAARRAYHPYSTRCKPHAYLTQELQSSAKNSETLLSMEWGTEPESRLTKTGHCTFPE
jgi:hypothetical protein